MKKTHKRIDNKITLVLKQFCESEKDKNKGFEWVTHSANYDLFPDSLSILCVYRSNSELAKVDRNGIFQALKVRLESVDVKLKDMRSHVNFDSEENCTNENGGKWRERLRRFAQ